MSDPQYCLNVFERNQKWLDKKHQKQQEMAKFLHVKKMEEEL